MHQTHVNINGKARSFVDPKQAFTYIMNLAICRSECMDLSALKENACAACDLISEMLLIKIDELDTTQKTTKSNFKRLSTRLQKTKGFLNSLSDKRAFLLAWTDLMMTIDGKPLLRGFGFGSKKHLGVEIGNAEKISLTKVVR